MAYWAHSDPNQPDHDDGQRPCACDTRCAERDPSGQPKLGPRAFCDTCRLQIRDCLAWLPEAYVLLRQKIGDRRTGQGEKVSSTPTPSAPYNFQVDTLLTDMAGLLEEWATRVREVAHLYQVPEPEAQMRREAVVVAAAERTLSAHLDVLLALPPAPMRRYLSLDQAAELTGFVEVGPDGTMSSDADLSGADAGLEIIHLHGRARSTLGLNPKPEHVPVPCWSCGLRMVTRRDGAAGLADDAECGNPDCREQYTHDRYLLLIRQVAEQQQKTGTRRKASA